MTKTTLAKLRELRRLLDFENENGANFTCICGVYLHPDAPYPKRPVLCGHIPLPRTEREADDFIKERTRLWRQSWVLPVLDELIAQGEKGRG